MKYFLIAGEPSGDQHGSALMRSIRQLDPEAEFRFLGGDFMERTGGPAVIHIRELSFMGFSQVFTRLPDIRRYFNICKSAILEFNPDIVIPIDYGGFNLRLIRWLKKNHLRSVYYITPKVWAWMPSRARKLAMYTDKALCVLPFEPAFLDNYGVVSEYVGSPVKEYILPVKNADPARLRIDLGLDPKPVIALLPGSRRQEISMILPVMSRLTVQFPDYRFVIGGHPNFPEKFYQDFSGSAPIQVIYGKTLELLRIADAALVTSGTATLEAGLLGVPQVVCYKSAIVSWLIARIVIRVRYISLVNLILQRSCVEELIQFSYTAGNLRLSLEKILNDPAGRQEILNGYRELNDRLGVKEASKAAAAIVYCTAAQSR